MFRRMFDTSGSKENEHFAVLHNGELCDGFDVKIGWILLKEELCDL